MPTIMIMLCLLFWSYYAYLCLLLCLYYLFMFLYEFPCVFVRLSVCLCDFLTFVYDYQCFLLLFPMCVCDVRMCLWYVPSVLVRFSYVCVQFSYVFCAIFYVFVWFSNVSVRFYYLFYDLLSVRGKRWASFFWSFPNPHRNRVFKTQRLENVSPKTLKKRSAFGNVPKTLPPEHVEKALPWRDRKQPAPLCHIVALISDSNSGRSVALWRLREPSREGAADLAENVKKTSENVTETLGAGQSHRQLHRAFDKLRFSDVDWCWCAKTETLNKRCERKRYGNVFDENVKKTYMENVSETEFP